MQTNFVPLNYSDVEQITLEECKDACTSQLNLQDLELAIAGDFDINEVLELVRKYLGTIPSSSSSSSSSSTPSHKIPTLAKPSDFEVEITDSDPRAVAYVAGASPNKWGFFADGTNVGEIAVEKGGKGATKFDTQRRNHPLFGNVALSLISEIINRRLFSTVREKKQLTYDANFHFTSFEQIKGGFFLITVTASKEKAQEAMKACKVRRSGGRGQGIAGGGGGGGGVEETS